MKESDMYIYFLDYELKFKEPAGTSRGTYTTRPVRYAFATLDRKRWGVGEIAPLPDLSEDGSLDTDTLAKPLLQHLNQNVQEQKAPWEGMAQRWPSMGFGIFTAIRHLHHGGLECTEEDIESGRVLHMQFPPEQWVIFDSAFARGEKGIPINGLVWMGTLDEMKARAQAKIDAGYRCIKLKIGAINFEEELELLRYIRAQRGPEELELRVDANGGFTPEEAPEKLRRLAEFQIHSIEQPIRAGQWEAMGELVRTSPIPIALDEELIGVHDRKRELLQTIHPDYLVFKPTLIGIDAFFEWANLIAEEEGKPKFWLTSALESNIGLNAIAQLVAYIADQFPQYFDMAQGLGTGQLFTDNVPIPLTIEGDQLYFNKR
jgi:L-alanine-DL-glutamate epimerase-like enolase superfamily enzyme